MSRKAGQLISRGSRTWLVRVSLGRDPESATRKYHNKTIRGSFVVWSDSFDADLNNPLELQSRVAASVVTGLENRVFRESGALDRARHVGTSRKL